MLVIKVKLLSKILARKKINILFRDQAQEVEAVQDLNSGVKTRGQRATQNAELKPELNYALMVTDEPKACVEMKKRDDESKIHQEQFGGTPGLGLGVASPLLSVMKSPSIIQGCRARRNSTTPSLSLGFGTSSNVEFNALFKANFSPPFKVKFTDVLAGTIK
eukprot:Gb_08810 [translate_table: standard]